jgi:hypothetical protein
MKTNFSEIWLYIISGEKMVLHSVRQERKIRIKASYQ